MLSLFPRPYHEVPPPTLNSGVDYHIKTRHSVNRVKQACSNCGKEFASDAGLQYHINKRVCFPKVRHGGSGSPLRVGIPPALCARKTGTHADMGYPLLHSHPHPTPPLPTHTHTHT